MLKRAMILSALVGLSLTVNIPASAVEGGYCQKHSHTGSGRGPTKSVAKTSARQKWRFEVLKHGHPHKILWSASKNRNTKCNSKVYGYKCWARAIPCAPVGAPVREKKKPTTTQKGVNLTPWCKKKFGKGFKAKLVGKKDAGSWTCERTLADRRPISVGAACKLQYGKKAYKAKALNWKDPYSWKCLIR